jgi:hypothetical protein
LIVATSPMALRISLTSSLPFVTRYVVNDEARDDVAEVGVAIGAARAARAVILSACTLSSIRSRKSMMPEDAKRTPSYDQGITHDS